ncbi:MAG: glycosyltransferase family 4 protein [Vicingaceae bacterium]
MEKVVIVTNIPNHYRIPLFNQLNLLLLEERIKLTVIFGAAGYAFRKNKVELETCEFNYKVLEKSGGDNGNITYLGLTDCLKIEDPDLIVVSGFNKATLKTMFHSFITKIPYFIWSGSVEIGNRKTSFLKKLYRRVVINYAKGFIAYGSMAKQYMHELGAPLDRVYAIGNSVDAAKISAMVEKEREVSLVRRLLYLGYLTPLKNLFPLLKVIDELRKVRTDFIFDVVGDGESRKELELEVQKKGLEDLIKFHGFKQRDEVPKYYAKADVFLFQTEADIWGLVLNEAMSAAIPTLVSKRAGAAVDLIIEGETGFVVDFHNTEEVAKKINWILNHPKEAKRIGEKAAQFIEKEYSIGVVASRFKEAIVR